MKVLGLERIMLRSYVADLLGVGRLSEVKGEIETRPHRGTLGALVDFLEGNDLRVAVDDTSEAFVAVITVSRLSPVAWGWRRTIGMARQYFVPAWVRVYVRWTWRRTP